MKALLPAILLLFAAFTSIVHAQAKTERPPATQAEEWDSSENDIVHARFQMTYSGTNTHTARHQEIPAIFVDASLATLVTYTGTAPWTSAALTRRTPGADNEYVKITENWVAYVDAKDF